MNTNNCLEEWLNNKKWFHLLINGWLSVITLIIWFFLYITDKINIISGFDWRFIVIVLIGLFVLFFVGLVVFFMGYLGLKIAMSIADSLPAKMGYTIKTMVAIAIFVIATIILLGVGQNRFDLVGRF